MGIQLRDRRAHGDYNGGLIAIDSARSALAASESKLIEKVATAASEHKTDKLANDQLAATRTALAKLDGLYQAMLSRANILLANVEATRTALTKPNCGQPTPRPTKAAVAVATPTPASKTAPPAAKTPPPTVKTSAPGAFAGFSGIYRDYGHIHVLTLTGGSALVGRLDAKETTLPKWGIQETISNCRVQSIITIRCDASGTWQTADTICAIDSATADLTFSQERYFVASFDQTMTKVTVVKQGQAKCPVVRGFWRLVNLGIAPYR